jgi:hypothetical protein
MATNQIKSVGFGINRMLPLAVLLLILLPASTKAQQCSDVVGTWRGTWTYVSEVGADKLNHPSPLAYVIKNASDAQNHVIVEIIGADCAGTTTTDVAADCNNGKLTWQAPAGVTAIDVGSTSMAGTMTRHPQDGGNVLARISLTKQSNQALAKGDVESLLKGACSPLEESVDYTITAKHSGKCLDVHGGTPATGNSTQVQQYGCHGGPNQRWILNAAGSGFYTIKAKNSGKCLDVHGRDTGNEVNVEQFDCNGGDNQKWQLNRDGDGYFTMRAKHSGKCLDIHGAEMGDEARAQQYDCNGSPNQKWQLSKSEKFPLVFFRDDPNMSGYSMSSEVKISKNGSFDGVTKMENHQTLNGNCAFFTISFLDKDGSILATPSGNRYCVGSNLGGGIVDGPSNRRDEWHGNVELEVLSKTVYVSIAHINDPDRRPFVERWYDFAKRNLQRIQELKQACPDCAKAVGIQ